LNYTATNGSGSDVGTVNINSFRQGFINEILFNPPGNRCSNEYIELAARLPLLFRRALTWLAIEGDSADNPGDVQTIINLSGLTFGSNGFWFCCKTQHLHHRGRRECCHQHNYRFWWIARRHILCDGGATDIEDDSVTFMLIKAASAPTLTDDNRLKQRRHR